MNLQEAIALLTLIRAECAEAEANLRREAGEGLWQRSSWAADIPASSDFSINSDDGSAFDVLWIVDEGSSEGCSLHYLGDVDEWTAAKARLAERREYDPFTNTGAISDETRRWWSLSIEERLREMAGRSQAVLTAPIDAGSTREGVQ